MQSAAPKAIYKTYRPMRTDAFVYRHRERLARGVKINTMTLLETREVLRVLIDVAEKTGGRYGDAVNAAVIMRNEVKRLEAEILRDTHDRGYESRNTRPALDVKGNKE